MPRFYFTMARNQILHHWPDSRVGSGFVEVIAVDSDAAEKAMNAAFNHKWSFRYNNLEEMHPLDRNLLFTITAGKS